MRSKPNNYFHVRIYTDDGGKIEFYRDRKKPSTRKEIADGLREAVALVERIDAACEQARVAKAEGQ